MQIRQLLVALGIFGLFSFLFLFRSGSPSHAGQRTMNIIGNAFSPSTLSISTADQIKFENEDAVSHVIQIKSASNSAVLHTETFAPKASGAPDTYTRSFTVAGNYLIVLDSNVATASVTVSQATSSASPTGTATPTPPTALPTSTMLPTASATFSAAPTASPSVIPTATSTVAPTEVPTPTSTASPTLAPTTAPTATPSLAPTILPLPSVVPTSTPSPTSIPTATPTVSPLPNPVALPTFAVFRKAMCNAQLVSNNTQVITDKTTSAYLHRGWWNIESVTQDSNGVSVSLHLFQTQRFSLFFGLSSFFGTLRNNAADERIVLSGATLSDVTDKARDAWCSR